MTGVSKGKVNAGADHNKVPSHQHTVILRLSGKHFEQKIASSFLLVILKSVQYLPVLDSDHGFTVNGGTMWLCSFPGLKSYTVSSPRTGPSPSTVKNNPGFETFILTVPA